MSRLASVSIPARSSVPVQITPDAQPLKAKLDRLQLSSWALLRNQQTSIAGSRSLASGGPLGASQAGARLVYNFNRQLASSARMSSEVGRRGGEVAAGIRVRPLVHIPVWLTAERRQRLGRFGGGRNDFALFAEGGVYQQPIPWRFALDAYLQGGVVGFKPATCSSTAALTFTRPSTGNFSVGFGVWGGAQPGLYRLDVGPAGDDAGRAVT